MTEKPSDPAQDAGPREIEVIALDAGGENARIAAVREPDRTFKIAMTLAFLIHALLFLSLLQAKPRRIGNPDGSQNAISVSILTEKDLKSRATIEDSANPAPPGPAAPPPPPPELKPTTETPPAAPPPPEAKPTEEPPQKPEAEQPKEEPKPEEQKADTTPEPEPLPDFETKTEKTNEKPEPEKKVIAPPAPNIADKALKELLEKTDPFEAETKKAADKEKAEKERTQKAENKSSRPPRPERQQVPDMVMPGGGAGVQRPPGYTKSGENDAFARGVIRALQRTMPQLRSTLGTVTVRIDLDRNGNLVKVSIMRPSGVAGLDQSVAFAVQQTSFPLPPVNATPADLTFFVRYVYN